MKKVFVLGIMGLILLGMASVSSAAKLHVEWCPCAGADGYKVYYGTTSGVYSNSWDNGTSTTYDSDPLPEGVYFVKVSAVYGTSEAFSGEKVVVAVENGDSAAGWSVLKGALPVPGYDSLLPGNALYFNPVVTVAVASSKVSIANVPASAVNLYYNFNATGSGGYVAVSMTTKSKGLVTLYYKLQDSNSLGTTTAILGIGSTMNDGQWHTIHFAGLGHSGGFPAVGIISARCRFAADLSQRWAGRHGGPERGRSDGLDFRHYGHVFCRRAGQGRRGRRLAI